MSSDELESCERLRGMSSEDKEECDHSKAVLQEVCSVLCGSPDGRGVWGRMDTCICRAKSFF